MHRALSAIRNNGVYAFQGELYTGSIGPIVGTLESVRIIEVSAFQRCPQGGVPLYVQCILNMYIYMWTVLKHVCVSLSVQLFRSPFAVVLDHSKKSLVVTIRGTLSMEVCCYGYIPTNV